MLIEMIKVAKRFKSKILPTIIVTGMVGTMLVLASCSKTTDEDNNQVNDYVMQKASQLLITQVNLRKEQIASPTAERLELMKNMGMRLNSLKIQQIFIHLKQVLTATQIDELKALGITIYPDSWIPPVGTHPTGFVLADMPIDRLASVASKDYVVSLDTAERQLQPQDGLRPQ